VTLCKIFKSRSAMIYVKMNVKVLNHVTKTFLTCVMRPRFKPRISRMTDLCSVAYDSEFSLLEETQSGFELRARNFRLTPVESASLSRPHYSDCLAAGRSMYDHELVRAGSGLPRPCTSRIQGVKRPKREPDLSLPSPTEAKNVWSFTSTSHTSSWR
jgi:hypothetical protein